MTNDELKAFCEQWQSRAAELQLKGKKRTDAAINYFIGAAALAKQLGLHDRFNRLSFVAFMVACRGHGEVEDVLAAIAAKPTGID